MKKKPRTKSDIEKDREALLRQITELGGCTEGSAEESDIAVLCDEMAELCHELAAVAAQRRRVRGH